MACPEIYANEKIEGYENMSGYDQELYDMCKALDEYESHICFDGSGAPLLFAFFLMGVIAGRLIKRVF
jgi:hypothetical protein